MSTSVLNQTDRRREALEPLVASGELSPLQVEHVMRALDEWRPVEAGEPAAGVPAAAARPWLPRLAEVGAYLGAALLASGAMLIIGQNWRAIGWSGQVILLAGLAVAFAVAGVAVSVFGVREYGGVRARAVMRRLASTLFVLGTASVGGLVLRLFVPERGDMTDARVGWMLVTAGAVCALLLIGVRRVAPSALDEIALLGAVIATTAGVLVLVVNPDVNPALAMVPLFVLGLAWAFLAMLTQALTVPTLGVCLGLLVSLYACAGAGDQTVAEVLLAVLAVIAFTVYVLRTSWPWVVAALVSAVAFTVVVVGNAMNMAVALLFAGVVLLVLAAAAFAVQRHRSRTAQ
jgi:hypothetical protein